jgi:FSR family fosmidomycin resistance protein-like MFS transporter
MMMKLLGPFPSPARGGGGLHLRPLLAARRRALSILLSFVALRAIVAGSVTVFTPAYLIARGMSLVEAAAGYALFELAGALGALGGGTLSDRLGRRRTLIAIQILVVPCFSLLAAGPERLVVPFLALTGALVFSGTPVILALVQELLPEARSTASGLYFSLNYIATGLAAVLFGVLADLLGIERAFGWLALAPLLTLPFALSLPTPRRSGSTRSE